MLSVGIDVSMGKVWYVFYAPMERLLIKMENAEQ